MVKQAFGSPGGKTRLASRIVDIMPEHKIYVEPFAGGAAVYFHKDEAIKEVLNDKDSEIAFAFKFLRDMTPQQYSRLRKKNWTASRETFKKVKAMKPRNDVDRFYKFYYLRWCSFGAGGVSMSPLREGQTKDITRLKKIQQRLKKTRVHNVTATKLIDKYDSKDTLFYLDPPYPDRAFIGSTFGKYTVNDLLELLKKLKKIKGKFILSLGPEHTKYMPKSWRVKRMKLRRNIPKEGGEWNKGFQYEIVVSNFPMNGTSPATTKRKKRKVNRSRRGSKSGAFSVGGIK